MAKNSFIFEEPEGAVQQDLAAVVSVAELPLDWMMAEERRTQILQIVRTAGRARVNDLVAQFNTSAVTIRHDLNELHQR
jgi:hypothetical protein